MTHGEIIVTPFTPDSWRTPERQFTATYRTVDSSGVHGLSVYGPTAEMAELKLRHLLAKDEVAALDTDDTITFTDGTTATLDRGIIQGELAPFEPTVAGFVKSVTATEIIGVACLVFIWTVLATVL